MKSTQLRKKVLLVLIVMVLAGLVLSVGTALYTCDWEGLFLNFGTELLGAAVTYYLFDRVIRRMEEFEAEKEELEAKKADLIARMGSNRQDVAVAAAEELRRHGWLYDGLLQGASLTYAELPGVDLAKANLQEVDLFQANLQEAELFDANLQEARLTRANLQEAYLSGTNLHGASLRRANLQKAYLAGANLQRADLRKANLQEADLGGANLQGANLQDANLQGTNLLGKKLHLRVEVQETDLQEADLQDARVLERLLWNGRAKILTEGYQQATLPDGTKWTPGTDMARFTDPKHPDFWRPDA